MNVTLPLSGMTYSPSISVGTTSPDRPRVTEYGQTYSELHIINKQ